MPWDDCLSNGVATVDCIFPLFQNIINAALVFGGITALFFILFSGFKLLTSGGDSKKVASARQTLLYAILGLILVFISFFIINLIANLTNVNCITSFSFKGCE